MYEKMANSTTDNSTRLGLGHDHDEGPTSAEDAYRIKQAEVAAAARAATAIEAAKDCVSLAEAKVTSLTAKLSYGKRELEEANEYLESLLRKDAEGYDAVDVQLLEGGEGGGDSRGDNSSHVVNDSIVGGDNCDDEQGQNECDEADLECNNSTGTSDLVEEGNDSGAPLRSEQGDATGNHDYNSMDPSNRQSALSRINVGEDDNPDVSGAEQGNEKSERIDNPCNLPLQSTPKTIYPA